MHISNYSFLPFTKVLPAFWIYFTALMQKMLQLSVQTVQISCHQAPVFMWHPRDSHASPAQHCHSWTDCALQWFVQPG